MLLLYRIAGRHVREERVEAGRLQLRGGVA